MVILFLSLARFKWYSLPQVGSIVHGQASSATAESVSLRSVFASVAVLAVQDSLVLTAVCGVQGLVAHAYEGGTEKGFRGKVDEEMGILGNSLHLKQVLWNLYPPATRSSAA